MDACSRGCARLQAVCALSCSHVGLHADIKGRMQLRMHTKGCACRLYAHNYMIAHLRIQPCMRILLTHVAVHVCAYMLCAHFHVRM
jgi:hypothetical protein